MTIMINGVYKHYKGNFYKVLAVGKHTETLDELVVYQSLYGDHQVWGRPQYMWNETLEYNGKIVKRFELVKDYNGQI